MRRYERYKDTKIEWLGQIPHHWEIKKLRYLFNFNTGLSVTKAEFIEDGIKCINYGDIHTKYSFKLNLTNAILPKIDQIFMSEKPSCLLSENDLVFCDTSEDLDGVGNCVVISNLNGLQLLSGSHTIAAKPKQLLDSVFIRYSLMSKIIKSKIENKVTGIKVFSITQSILNSISVTFPPLLEQQQIAEYLDQQTTKIDNLVQKQYKLIELLQEKKKSLINHVVTKGLNPDVQMRDSGIEWLGQIPEHWNINLFKKSLSSLVDYRGKTPVKVDDGIFLVTARNIKNGSIDYNLSQEYVNEHDYEEIMSRGRPLIGDILFTTEAPLGEVALVDNENIALAQRIIKVRANSKHLLGTFLKLQMYSDFFQYQLQVYSSGSTALGIKSERLCYLKIIYPTLSEQQQIAEYLDQQIAKIDELINKAKSMVQLLKEHKQSLINNVVTGKIKVIDETTL